MKQFNGPKPVAEITENLKSFGFSLDTQQYNRGSDYVDYFFGKILDQSILLIMLCPWDGRFIVSDHERNILGSESSNLDGTPWYDALLEAIYKRLPIDEKLEDRAAVIQDHLKNTPSLEVK